MIEVFYMFLGEYATMAIDFYRANQVILNIVVVAYGLLLTLAHRNVVRMESYLKDQTGEKDMFEVRTRIESGEGQPVDLDALRKKLRIPILASPFHLTFFPLTEKAILRILKKKYPRSAQS
jgi:hypothetical protein